MKISYQKENAFVYNQVDLLPPVLLKYQTAQFIERW